jgi:TP901 family phage tail tape measure protein
MASTAVVYNVIARDNASRTFDRVGRSAGATERMLGKLGRAAAVAGKAMAVGLVAGLGESAKKAAEFQSEMTRISTQAGGTAKDVKTLSDQVLKLGTSTQQGPQHLAESLYHLKSVGMDNVQAMKALKEASDLAAVGHANLEETTNALAGAWRTGIKGATSFHEAVSTVNAIIGAGNMSMDQFNAAIGTGILPSAKTFGLSMKQVGAALALMTDEGIDSASAATRLRMSFSLLGAPSKAAEKQLGKIGLTGLQLADAMRGPKGLIGAIGLLKEHLDKSGLSASKQSQLLSRAFGGGRSSSGILLMLNNLDVLEKKQEQINRSTGKFDDAVKQQRKTAEAQWHLLVSNLEVMGIRVGTKVLPPVTDFVHFLATDAMPAAAHFGKAVAGIIPVGAIKKGFSEAKGLVDDFFGSLSGGKTAKALPTPMLKAPAVPKALALPAPKMTDAGKLGKTIHDAIQGGFKGIKWGDLGSTLGKGLGDAIGWVGKHAADLTKKMGDTLAKIDFVDVGKALGGQALPFAIGLVINLFEPLFHVSFWKKHWWDTILAILSVIPVGKAAGVLEKLFTKIPILKAFSPMLKGLEGLGGLVEKGLGKFVLKPLGKFGKAILDGIGSGFTKVFPETAGKLDEFIGKLAINILGYTGRFVGFGERLIGGMGRGILGVGTKIGEWAGKIIGWLLKPFAKIGGWLLRKGADFISGLTRGITGAAKGLSSWAWRRAGRPIVDAFKSAGSTLLGKGRAFVGGMKDGIVAAAKGLGGWVWRTVGRPGVDAFKTVGSWLLGKGKSFVGGLKSGVVGAARGIGSWVRSRVITPSVGAFKTAGSLLKSKGSAFVSGMKAGIVGAVKGIGSWIKKYLVDPVVSAVKKWFGIRSPSRVFMSIGGHLVSGLMKGMAKTSGTAIAKRVFGSLPKALAALVKKGLVSIAGLPSKALKALGGLGGDILGLLGLGGSGGGSSANQKIGQTLAATRGWSGPQWAALKNLWNGESGWNERALNKSSGAYGIPQSLPASKMASAGSDWKTSASTQIKWGLSYIASRYGNPVNAYSAWLSRSPHWYAKGTGGAARGLAWVGEKGPELVNFKGGEDVLSHPQSMMFAKANGIKLPGYASGTIMNAADRYKKAQERVEDAKDKLASAKRRHKGIKAAEKELEAAETQLKAARISLANAKRSAKVSISNTINTGLLKKLETGTSSAIASAIKGVATKLLNAGYNKTAASVQKKGAKLESLADKRASVQKKIAEANQYAADQAGNIRDFLSISGTSATSVGDLISQAGAQQKTASGFVALTKSLKARGASKELLQQLSDAGPGSQLATILSQKNVTTGDIDKLNKLMSSGSKLATSFGKDMADMMYDSGKHAGEGFLTGLKATEKDLQKQINSLAKSLVKEIKKALKIKSPSGVFRDEVGKQVVLGMMHGIDMHSHLVGGAAQRLADTATGISMRRRYVPTAAPSRSGQDETWERLAAALEQQSSQPQHLTGQLVLDSGELLGVIQGTVKPMVKASERNQAHRAKVGRRNG